MAFQTRFLGGEYKVESDIGGKEEEDSSSDEDASTNEEEYEGTRLQQSEKCA